MGLVFALASNLVHDIHKTPNLCCWTLTRRSTPIESLVWSNNFKQYAEYLVVALLTEDAAVLDDDNSRITEI